MSRVTFIRDCCVLLSSSYHSDFRINKIFSVFSSTFHMDHKDESKSQKQTCKVPIIVSIFRQALETFDKKAQKDFSANFSRLKTMMDQLTSEHFHFDQSLNDPATWNHSGKAPCTYIEVFENDQVNMSIFVLKPGFKMPLHDHPHMHGLLKVISGAVKIKSFTEHPLAEKNVDPIKFAKRVKDEAKRILDGKHKKRKFFAEISKNHVCKANSSTCVLTPTLSNYHEIEALEMPAAFFDILSPPYDTLIEGVGPRRCKYYNIVNEISTNLVELHETEAPECFYCDRAPYLGPALVANCN